MNWLQRILNPKIVLFVNSEAIDCDKLQTQVGDYAIIVPVQVPSGLPIEAYITTHRI